MISAAMNAKLNEQVATEFSAAHAYLAMACAFERMGLKVLYQRFIAQHQEELTHAMKIIDYIQRVDGTVSLEAIPEPRADFESVESIVHAALEAERDVTQKINALVALADSENDYASRSFLQWFVDEQVEEEESMTDLLSLVRLAGNNLIAVEQRVRHEMAGTA